MVVPLGPGKFNGSSLPRPRIYTHVKLNDTRVDPPAPVLDPLLGWAEEAHWSMDGLSLKRLRLQGKIEGNIQRLKKENESKLKRKVIEDVGSTDSPPAAPISKKRMDRGVLVVDEDVKKRRRLVRKLGEDFELVVNEELDGVGLRTRSRSTPRRSMILNEDEFDNDGGSEVEEVLKSGLLKKVRKKSVVKGSGCVSPVNGTRSSPRLKKK